MSLPTFFCLSSATLIRLNKCWSLARPRDQLRRRESGTPHPARVGGARHRAEARARRWRGEPTIPTNVPSCYCLWCTAEAQRRRSAPPLGPRKAFFHYSPFCSSVVLALKRCVLIIYHKHCCPFTLPSELRNSGKGLIQTSSYSTFIHMWFICTNLSFICVKQFICPKAITNKC